MSDILEMIRAKRGYLLPFHKMLAVHDPELLRRYDHFYEKMTLDQNVLTPFEKEFVWIAILAAAREGVGSLHLDRAKIAGLSQGQMQQAVSLAALAESFPAFFFGMDKWGKWLDVDQIEGNYLKLVEVAGLGIAPALVELAMLVSHGIRLDPVAFGIHLKRFDDFGGTSAQLSEALTYLFNPKGANMVLDVAAMWEKVATELNLPKPY